MPNTVKPLAVRRAQTFSVSVVDFLVSVHGCRTSTLRFTHAEKMSLWRSYCLMYPRLSKAREPPLWDESVCTAQERLGWLLLDVDARAKSRPVAAGGSAWKEEWMDDIEQQFSSAYARRT